MEHLNRNIGGAGWIIQDRETGKRVLGSLAEWLASAGSYCGELLEMLAVWVLLLAAECFYESSTEEQERNRVSCNSLGALYTFVKKSKWVPASSGNLGVKRALQEVNRKASNKYCLEQTRGHQDRAKSIRHLFLEAQLNVECNIMAKGIVKGSITKNLEEEK